MNMYKMNVMKVIAMDKVMAILILNMKSNMLKKIMKTCRKYSRINTA